VNRFGLGERGAPQPLVDDHESRHHPLLTLAYLHWWDKGTRVPADIAARLIEEGYDVEPSFSISLAMTSGETQ
jgi:hypothetical protein